MRNASGDKKVDRQTEDLFASHQRSIYKHTDRMFAVLMSLQFLGGIGAAFWFSPKTWVGEYSGVSNNVWAAIFLGGLLSIFPIYLALKFPGERSTRYVIAVAQMLMSSLLIHVTGGRVETHFHLFGSLAFLSFYRDWRVLVPATLVVAVDHIVRGVFWPQSVYGVLAEQDWRWVEHTFWVIFENTFLVIAIKRSVSEMWEIARRTSETRQLNDSLEQRITKRTDQLETTNRDLENEIVERRRIQVKAEVISEVIQGVATTANLNDLLQLIQRSIGRVMNADNCYVALFDAQTDLLSIPFCIDKYDTAASPAKLGKGLTAYVIRKGRPMLMTSEVIRELTAAGDVISVGTVPAIWLGVPLRTPDGITGALVVQHYEDETAYDAGDVEFLSSVAGQIALAIARKTGEEGSVRLNAEIDLQRQRLDNIVTSVPGVVWETGGKPDRSTQRINFVSSYVETLLGYSVEEWTSAPDFWLSIIHPDDKHHTGRRIGKDFAKGFSSGPIEFRWIAKDGHSLWVESNYVVVKNDEGRSIGFRGVSIDISQRKSFEEQLTHQALHDPLTKLGNRTLFRDRVEHAISRTTRSHAPVAVLFLDLDNFKTVNDSLGHAAGDKLLISVTERLQGCLRSSDTPARLGGDEFAVLLEDLEHVGQACSIAERIRTVLCAPFSIAGTEVFIGSSIGIATAVDGHETPEELLRNADVAMYMSKSNGRDRVTVFENQMHDVLIKRIRLESDLRSAVENREFEIYYQPILDLGSEQTVGMEALLRWNHPEHGLILPRDFIPLADETGLIIPLGRWILEEACMQARTWQTLHGYGEELSVTVNVAGRQFQDDSLEDIVRQALVKSNLPPKSLVLEITESTMLADTESTMKKLEKLKKLGVRFAIDDFGTGYSSLSYLQRFQVDILKIDKSFIDKIAMTKEGAAVVKAIITMSETLNLMTIAEGIESADQQIELRQLGCELGQGYHFAKPLRVPDMNEFLGRSSVQSNKTRAFIPPAGKNIVLA
jgi:diguanylate cyclase (GGDEF)-like protein/PAS domain S-box-containing protein